MADNNIKALLNNIDIAISVFPEEKAGLVEFTPLEEYESADGLISFSALITIEYNGVLEQELSLKLVKLATDDGNALQTFSLEAISFSNNHEFYGQKGKVECVKEFESCSIDVRDFDHRHCLRYSFSGIPLCGDGVYFLSVGVEDDNYFLPIKSAPIVVKIIGKVPRT